MRTTLPLKFAIPLLLCFTSASAYAAGEGLWRCEFSQYEICDSEGGKLGNCSWKNYQKMPREEIEWMELDLDAAHPRLYLCTPTGCATGTIKSPDPAALTLIVHTGVLGHGGFLRPENPTVAFIVEEIHAPFISVSTFIFRLKHSALGAEPTKPPATLFVVGDIGLRRGYGNCRRIDELSKSGNPLDWVFEPSR